jgi:SAM-dependent methyltransferase
MIRSDEDNLELVESADGVDALNAKFYGRFPFPWLPQVFNCPTDPDFETFMLNQSIGSWNHSVVPRRANIWVAGCGTNQAIFTALRFPNASITASDISAAALTLSACTAKQLGITNLTFREESINRAAYREEFDYVICTGVIHHNADPRASLQRLAAALKPSGVLELMVYNRYHRVMTTAFQKAIRAFGAEEANDFEAEMRTAKLIIGAAGMDNTMSCFLQQYTDCPEVELADALLQPVEHSYTVESLDALAARCGLEFLAPCISPYDKAKQTISWNMKFDQDELQRRYDSLPDFRRWQISNLLKLEKSPMLWFYLQRRDASRPRKTEPQLSDEFLGATFTRSETTRRAYLRADDGNYVLREQLSPYPGTHPNELCRTILDAVDNLPGVRMKEILRALKVEPDFQLLHQLRLALTTNALPFLKAT